MTGADDGRFRPGVNRRQFLAAVGTTTLGALSGCEHQSSGGGGGPNTDSPTPKPIAYKVTDFEFFVKTASDALFDGPNTVELFGQMWVFGEIGSHTKIFPVGSTNLKYPSVIWNPNLNEAVSIAEGNTQQLSLRYNPVVLKFGSPSSFNRKDARIVVWTVLREADDGWNAPEMIKNDTFNWILHGSTGRFKRVLSNKSTEVHLKFKINQR